MHAGLAQELAATLGGAQWRFVITDEQGQLSHCGITAARPNRRTWLHGGLPRDRETPGLDRLPGSLRRGLKGILTKAETASRRRPPTVLASFEGANWRTEVSGISPSGLSWPVCARRLLTTTAYLHGWMPGWSGVERGLDLHRHRGGVAGRAGRGFVASSPPADQHRREARPAGGGAVASV
jgi:hypothetical protein